MSKPQKKKRLITNRDFFDKKSLETIDIDENGIFWWSCIDYGYLLIGTEDIELFCYKWIPLDVEDIQSSFPIDLETVKEFFIKCGRILDISLLPTNFKKNPYEMWI